MDLYIYKWILYYAIPKFVSHVEIKKSPNYGNKFNNKFFCSCVTSNII